MLNIRRAKKEDAAQLKELYFQHLTDSPPTEEQDMGKWEELIDSFARNDLYHLIVGEVDGRIASSVTIIIVQNLTHNVRPYAVIENVVTHKDFRGCHYATMLMDHAREIARGFGCYKIMLQTGSKEESTMKFYESCGYERNTKTAFFQELK